MMRRWLPAPAVSAGLLITWLLLTNSIAPAQFVLGGTLAVLIPLFTSRFRGPRIELRKPFLLVRFVARLLLDIVIANLAVARLILRPGATLQPRFITYRLRLRGEMEITVLANTISLTPGTVACDLNAERTCLLVHCLDVADEAAVIEQIRNRYESLLEEIFRAC